MKKFFKILFINTCLLILVIFISDIFLYNYLTYKGKNPINCKFEYKIKNIDLPGFDIKNYFNGDYENLQGRLPDGLKYKDKTPITIFGCSVAYGQNLETTQTFSYKLSEILKRPVYNRAIPGGGIQNMYFQTVDKGSKYFYKQVPPSDTVIYIFIPDHFRRMIRFTFFSIFLNCLNPIYNLKNNEFVFHNYNNPIINLIKASYTVKFFNLLYVSEYVKQKKNAEKLTDMVLLYFLKTRESLEKHWNRKINFVVVYYENIHYQYDVNVDNVCKDLFIKKLKDNGFEVISFVDLTDKDIATSEYKMDDGHPKEATWNLLTPLFADDLKKKKIF